MQYFNEFHGPFSSGLSKS